MPNTMDMQREQIDSIDREIVRLLERRFDCALQIAQFKRMNGIATENVEREAQVLAACEDTVVNDVYSESIKRIMSEVILRSKQLQNRKKNIYITGMPYAGKTTIAKRIAEATDYIVVDTDDLIVDEAEMSIAEVFRTEGESGFRKREHDALLLVAKFGDMIVSTGGGILTEPENIPIMKSSGYCIFLDRPLDELVKEHTRAAEDLRPLLVEGADDLTRLYYERIVQYRTNADIVIDAAKPDTLAKVMEYIYLTKNA